MKNKKRWPIVLALWLIFGVLVAGVAYMSFQSGEDSKQLGKDMIEKLAQMQYESFMLHAQNVTGLLKPA